MLRILVWRASVLQIWVFWDMTLCGWVTSSVSWRIILTIVCRARQSKKNSWLSFAVFLGLLDLCPFKMKALCSFDTQEPLVHWHSVAEPPTSPLCELPVWWLLYCLGALTFKHRIRSHLPSAGIIRRKCHSVPVSCSKWERYVSFVVSLCEHWCW